MLQPDFSVFPEISTPRLTLRRIVTDDAPEIFILRSDPVVMRYINKPPAQTLDDALNFVHLINDLLNKNEGITWGMSLNGGKLIGTIGLWRLIKEHYRAEIGYAMLPGYFGKGFMNEAMVAVLEYGFHQLKLHSVEAHVNPENIASAKLLEKNNFVREAYFREDFFYDGKFLDSAVYSLLSPLKFEP